MGVDGRMYISALPKKCTNKYCRPNWYLLETFDKSDFMRFNPYKLKPDQA